ncbi:class I SAM-dependent methyltransferase [Clostridium sp. Marseille-P299]|uniref:class I SAM-dependent methyltransferase n=1 Tax=Clostridium sp. Marseille-P299 TaxID=1805477 RepID=UPI00082C889F|nr:SAM-dependent methyltransferase [Clostridium sp. Marseille-P299]
MDSNIVKAFEQYINEKLEQVILSNSTDPDRIKKVKIRPVLIKGDVLFQITEYCGQKVLHQNVTRTEVLEKLEEWFTGLFKQAQISAKDASVTILVSKKGKATIKIKNKTQKEDSIEWDPLKPVGIASHNRVKQYILKEGVGVPFLIDLGIMTSEGKIVKSKYDKYKQINRFLEFIEDILPNLDKDKEISIIDFGCGKSYLTFAMYYYLKELQGYNVKITGLDLKEDVIAKCNELKERYGYDKMQFLKGDIASYEGTNQVDMVVTLHACDTATDYAMYKATIWGAKVILSVPCCQHELNKQISCEEIGSILQHGLIKERMAALFTDALRANLLETLGYKVQVMEFIDMEHTPKNILIRAVKSKTEISERVKSKKLMEYQKTIDFLNVNPTLYQLTQSQNL